MIRLSIYEAYEHSRAFIWYHAASFVGGGVECRGAKYWNKALLSRNRNERAQTLRSSATRRLRGYSGWEQAVNYYCRCSMVGCRISSSYEGNGGRREGEPACCADAEPSQWGSAEQEESARLDPTAAEISQETLGGNHGMVEDASGKCFGGQWGRC